MKILFIILITTFLNANIFDDFYIYKSNRSYEEKDYKSSFEYLNNIKNKNDKVFYNQGNILYLQEKYEEAIEYYEKVQNTELKHQINHNIANSYVKLEDYEKAIFYYKKALEYKKDEKTKYNLELSKLKQEEIEQLNKKDLLKGSCPVVSFGTLVELHEDTLFDRLYFDENELLTDAKIDEKKENIVSNTKDDGQKRDIIIEENKNIITEVKDAKLQLNSYFTQKWDKNAQMDSLNTLIIPLEKGVISDSPKPW